MTGLHGWTPPERTPLIAADGTDDSQNSVASSRTDPGVSSGITPNVVRRRTKCFSVVDVGATDFAAHCDEEVSSPGGIQPRCDCSESAQLPGRSCIGDHHPRAEFCSTNCCRPRSSEADLASEAHLARPSGGFWRRSSWVVAAVLALAACAEPAPRSATPDAPDETNEELIGTTDGQAAPGSSPDAGEPPEFNESAARVTRQERRHIYPDPLGDLQAQFGIAPLMLPLGAVTTTDLGIELTMHLDDWWRLESAGPAEFVLAPPGNTIGQLRPNLFFIRPVGYVDPIIAAYEGNPPGDETLPPDGLRQWIDGLDQVVLEGTETFEVSGRQVTRYDVDLDPELGPTSDRCSPGNCVDLLWNAASDSFVLRDEETVRYYEIEDPAGPIVVIVASETGNQAFLDRSDAFMRRLEIGPSAPHPVPSDARWANFSVVERGTWTVSGLPGIEIDIADYSFISQRPGAVLTGHPVVDDGGRAIIQPLTDGTGKRIASAEGLLEAFRADPDWLIAEGETLRWADGDGIERAGYLFSVNARLRGDDPTPPILLAPLEEGDDHRLPAWPAWSPATYMAVEIGDGRVYAIGSLAIESDAMAADVIADILDFASKIRFLP